MTRLPPTQSSRRGEIAIGGQFTSGGGRWTWQIESMWSTKIDLVCLNDGRKASIEPELFWQFLRRAS